MPNNYNGNGYNGGRNRNYNGNNYRNNGKRFNGNNNGYRNNGYNRNFDNRPADEMQKISLVKFKKKDFLIEDLNGKEYVISGSFTSEFLAEVSRVAEKYVKYQNVLKSKNPDPKIFGEIYDMLKNWCLMLINLNVNGDVYTMADINAGFNDFDALVMVYSFIEKRLLTSVDTLNNVNNNQHNG